MVLKVYWVGYGRDLEGFYLFLNGFFKVFFIFFRVLRKTVKMDDFVGVFLRIICYLNFNVYMFVEKNILFKGFLVFYMLIFE